MPKLVKILIILSLVLTSAIYISALFQIKSINISNQNCLKEEDLQSVKRQYIFTVSKDSLETDLKQKFFCASNISITKKYPSKIDIQVEVKKAAAQIADTNFQISESGQIIKGTDANIPILYLPGDIKIEENQTLKDKNIVSAAQIAQLIVKTDFHPATIRLLSNEDIALYETDQTVAIFTSKKDIVKQVDSLQQVLAAAKIDTTKLAKIDLRFEKPTVSFR